MFKSGVDQVPKLGGILEILKLYFKKAVSFFFFQSKWNTE